ncbi:hypothetical protein B7P43_G17469 [Cryptotermes secundus]|uniref:Sodium channel protein Nach n=1 Tax=Cryptotermes secundus TaxID=105785 RepID=A0A2J7R4A5_9NEOP|nr:hypothetical protein B7P43_G17469 [Cryptotermes secundus]
MEAFQHSAVSFAPDTTYLHWNTGFPAVTVCEKLDKNKIWNLAERMYPKADSATLSNLVMYLREMIYYKGKCSNCHIHCSGPTECPRNILDLAKQVLSSCSSLLGDCFWNSKQFDCCEKFYPELTPYGICYAINSYQTPRNITNHKTIDLISNKITGPGSLQFKTFVDSEIYVHSPEDAFHLGQQAEPDLGNSGLGYSYTVYFRITEIDNDPHISSLSVSQRGCVLQHENPLRMYKLYSSSACITECQAKAQLQVCGCVHHYATVSMGGATGLFLGASLISAVELIMYFCVRIIPRKQQRRINASHVLPVVL